MVNERLKQLQNKFKDYQRFIGALLILASYLWLGAMINTFIRPSNDGPVLLILAFLSVVLGIGLAFKQKQIKQEIEEER
ncbi:MULTISPECIES: YrhC family protein [Virgibacillus]|uniref:YrhC-like protein n=2 Tax=Virgibacillus TaxID=84406 RepID=A0A024QAG4_9BACI|nr:MULTISPECIES: YrhC family protein [Virgibacillus]EQB35881.1 hypothetical protein M948_12640 [Virgibacillus sp. CM-4]GGJ48962.1 hypothetical protein GCM10007111_08780 [Virgibacillus kapii]CDQ39493.1 hypothetical protein BN990_01798 [Virgibacillus massiliensis]